MSTPTKLTGSPVGAKEGTRIILREITATVHNSPPLNSTSNKNESLSKAHGPEIKVNFAREFAEVTPSDLPITTTPSIIQDTPSISSASSFQSLTSTLSTKSSSGICPDSPERSFNTSYSSSEIPGLDDLISACAVIRLDSANDTITAEQSFGDATFASATDESPFDRTSTRSRSVSPLSNNFNVTATLESKSNSTVVIDNVNTTFNNSHVLNNSNNIEKSSINLTINQQISPEYSTANETFSKTTTDDFIQSEGQKIISKELETVVEQSPQISQSSNILENNSSKAPNEFIEPLPVDSKNFETRKSFSNTERLFESLPDVSEELISATKAPTFLVNDNLLENTVSTVDRNVLPAVELNQDITQIKHERINEENLDSTLNIADFSDITSNFEPIEPSPEQYDAFKPDRASTCLIKSPENLKSEICDSSEKSSEKTSESVFSDAYDTFSTNSQVDFEKLKLEAANITQEIYNNSINAIDEAGFTTAPTGLFRESTNFDFLLNKNSSDACVGARRLEDSLYIKFDPLVSENKDINISSSNMLPHDNGTTQQSIDERNGEKEEELMPDVGTPKKNLQSTNAIAAIDRLIFYSPMNQGNQKREITEKITPTEKSPELVPVNDFKMGPELELIKSTVIQLQAQLEEQKQQIKEQEKEKEFLIVKNNLLQAEFMAKIDDQSVIIEEYEKSIIRLVSEREKNRQDGDVQKTALLTELQEVRNHLAASEAAFNDVHAKYERQKAISATSKINEDALNENISQNLNTIKILEHRYEQLKIHASEQLEKVNFELESMRKQHQSETLKLRAMLSKEELKTKTLTETINQKTKENAELTKILDELISKVDK